MGCCSSEGERGTSELAEGESIPGTEVDVAAVQCTLPVDKTTSNVLGFSCTLLKNSYTLEWLAFLPIRMSFSAPPPCLEGELSTTKIQTCVVLCLICQRCDPGRCRIEIRGFGSRSFGLSNIFLIWLLHFYLAGDISAKGLVVLKTISTVAIVKSC